MKLRLVLPFKKSGVAREDLFITTKLWVQHAGYEKNKQGF